MSILTIKTIISFVIQVIKHFIHKQCAQMAASLTYTTTLSIVPILTVLLIILSTIPLLENAREQIYNIIYSNLMPQSSSHIKQYINEFAKQSSNLTAVGIGVLFITTIITLSKIESSFNSIWNIDKANNKKAKAILKTFTYSTIRQLAIVIIVPLVLGISFVASASIQGFSFLNQHIYGYGINWVLWAKLITFSFSIIGFTAIYWFIPKTDVPIKNALIAGLSISLLFEITKYLFAMVMSSSTNYATIYGAFAALPILLIWIDLSWSLILLGVNISYILTYPTNTAQSNM